MGAEIYFALDSDAASRIEYIPVPYVLAGDVPDNSFSRFTMVKCNVKMAPSGEQFSTDTLPPCAVMISFTIARPSPAPSNCTPFPRQNLSNIRS